MTSSLKAFAPGKFFKIYRKNIFKAKYLRAYKTLTSFLVIQDTFPNKPFATRNPMAEPPMISSMTKE